MISTLENLETEYLNFSVPANYRIVIKGFLDKDWEERLGGLRIVKENKSKEITILAGEVKDQAELTGVLNSLYNLHKMIISVQLIKKNQS
jgi:hypothetical protein